MICKKTNGLSSEQIKRIEKQLPACSNCGNRGRVKKEKVNPEKFYLAHGTCKQAEELYYIQCEHCKGTTEMYHDTSADGSMIRDWENLPLISGIANYMRIEVASFSDYDNDKRKLRTIKKAVYCDRYSPMGLLPYHSRKKNEVTA